MGKEINSYILISDFNLENNNRGTAALGYGAVSFLRKNGFINDQDTILVISRVRNFFRKSLKSNKREYSIDGHSIEIKELKVLFIESFLYEKWGVKLFVTPFSKVLSKIKIVAAINGGDGFSDLYGEKLFYSRLKDIYISMKRNIPLIFLPQTIGPFKNEHILEFGMKILKYATNVYVRDQQFVNELKNRNIKYNLTKDLSAFMQPEKYEMNINPNSIGINVSGLAFSNSYNELTGKFDVYHEIITRIIEYFVNKDKTIYLIPHSYCYGNPEPDNDDMLACYHIYNESKYKEHLVFVDKNLTPPQVKYVISKMAFFIGTRMHSLFAAIFTSVPVFGLSYSYKFVGAFEANNLSKNQLFNITNMKADEIPQLMQQLDEFYSRVSV